MSAPLMEVQVPANVQPGQVFHVSTPGGVIPVQAPAGSYPGMTVRFTVPRPQAQPAVMEQAPAVRPFDGCQTGPSPIMHGNMPTEGLSQEQTEQGNQALALMRINPAFPAKRRHRDTIAHLLFIALAGLLAYLCFGVDSPYPNIAWRQSGITAGDAGTVVGGSALLAILTSMCIVQIPAFVVWTSLLAMPTILILIGLFPLGLSIMDGPQNIPVEPLTVFVSCFFAGVFWFLWVFCCFRHRVPFTIKLIEASGKIALHNPGLFLIPIVGGLLSTLWSVMCFVLYFKFSSPRDDYAIWVVLGLSFFGAQVCHKVCHVTACGVYGRWYHGLRTSLCSSLCVALWKSFGSIVIGSALILVVQTIVTFVRMGRRDAARRNIVLLIVCLALECVVKCLSAAIEFFSDYAYVQCAVRGVNFMEAVQITWSLMTRANLKYVVADLLVARVIVFGGLLGGIACAVFTYAMRPDGSNLDEDTTLQTRLMVAFIGGMSCTGMSLSILSSGSKTLMASWAENPEPLQRKDPQLHDDFAARCSASLLQARA